MFLFSNASTVTSGIRISLGHLNKLFQCLFLVAKCVFVGKRRNQHCISFHGLWSIQTQASFEFVILVWHIILEILFYFKNWGQKPKKPFIWKNKTYNTFYHYSLFRKNNRTELQLNNI